MKQLIALVGALCAIVVARPAAAGISHFEHIVLIVQENRTPDNLFYALCAEKSCGPGHNQYDIQLERWLNKNSKNGATRPRPLSLATIYDPNHDHRAWRTLCDFDQTSAACKMDGAADIICKKNCPADTSFTYVDNSRGTINPYLFIAENYGWANYMFQTNQGPSFPAHQFLFGATSAPSSIDDHKGTFVAENAVHNHGINGCIAPSGSTVHLINAEGVEFKNIYPCFEHKTLSDLLEKANLSWRYYTPGPGSLWSAPDAIDHICQAANGKCTGPIWRKHLALLPIQVVADVKACDLQDVSWVVPSAQYSDHAGRNDGRGPSWVASVINAIGNSPCKNSDGTSYWKSTAIIVTWDDWGGFYDHEQPTFLPYPEGGYQYGFRVPFLFVSAYTPQGYIDNYRLDFGSVLRFFEFNFGIPMGELSFADARSTGNLGNFYNLSSTPRAFQTIPASPFIPDVGDKLEPPDDD